MIDLRGRQKREWLKTHRAELDAYLREFGLAITLGHFNIRYRTLCQLLDLEENEPDILIYLRGGQKGKWLREHRTEVLDHLATYGILSTLLKFRTTSATLDRLLGRNPSDNDPRYRNTGKVAPAHPEPVFQAAFDAIEVAEKAKLIAQDAKQGVSDLRREIRELREQFSRFQDTVSSEIVTKFIRPLLERITVPDELEPKPDLLSLGEDRHDKPGDNGHHEQLLRAGSK
jgi:hypothetical protein